MHLELEIPSLLTRGNKRVGIYFADLRSEFHTFWFGIMRFNPLFSGLMRFIIGILLLTAGNLLVLIVLLPLIALFFEILHVYRGVAFYFLSKEGRMNNFASASRARRILSALNDEITETIHATGGKLRIIAFGYYQLLVFVKWHSSRVVRTIERNNADFLSTFELDTPVNNHWTTRSATEVFSGRSGVYDFIA